MARELPKTFEKFTPEEKKCISEKISTLVDEGKPRDQAVAVAIAECAPATVEKSKLKEESHELGESLTESGFFSDLPGGKFTAKENADGTWDIRDVPIMAEVPKGMRGAKEHIGVDWMAETLKMHSRNEKEQKHLPPIHIRHHGDTDTNEKAGFFRITRVGKLKQRGQAQAALFVTLTHVPNHIYQQIKNLELPYRSVEIFAWQKNEVASLALLSDESPFFKMPMLTIGREIAKPEKVEDPDMMGFPVLAASECLGGNAYLFSFLGARLEDDEKKKDDEDEKKKKELQETGGGGDEISIAVATLAKLKPAMEQLRALFEALLGSGEEKDNADGKKKDEGRVAPVEAKEGGSPEDETVDKTTEAKMLAEIEALKAKVEKRDRTDVVSTAVDAALADLKGYNLAEGMRERLIKMSDPLEDPKPVLFEFVKTFKESATKEPEDTLESFQEASFTDGENKVISKFAEKGPEAAESARKHAGKWKDCKSAGLRFDEDVTFEVFVEAQERYKASERERLGAAV